MSDRNDEMPCTDGETSWCRSFVNWCLAQNGAKSETPNRSRPGNVLVVWLRNGHVGFLDSRTRVKPPGKEV